MGSAQPNTGAGVSSESIFNQILQSMPADAKVRVDSASQLRSVQQRGGPQRTSPTKAGASAATTSMQDEALKGLPRELQERVQRTMIELEQDKKRRAVEFKDRATRKTVQ
jgi:hypothetical protein